MLTESQKRALRAKSLLDSGMDARKAARQLGYRNVTGMLGAISLCTANVQKKEAVFEGSLRSPKPKATLYPVKDGVITIADKALISMTYKPERATVHINKKFLARPVYLHLEGGTLIGGKAGLAKMLREIAEASIKCAALIEDEIEGGENDVDHHK